MLKLEILNKFGSSLCSVVLIGLSMTSCTPVQLAVKASDRIDTLRFMSFNILYGGDEVDFSKTSEAIKLADADIVGLQEAEGNTEKLAKALNYPYFDSKLHVLSSYPLIRTYENGWYYTFVETSLGNGFVFSNIHLPSDPYGPELVEMECQ